MSTRFANNNYMHYSCKVQQNDYITLLLFKRLTLYSSIAGHHCRANALERKQATFGQTGFQHR